MLKSFKFIITLPSSTKDNKFYAGVTLKASSMREAITRFRAMVEDYDSAKTPFAVEEVQ